MFPSDDLEAELRANKPKAAEPPLRFRAQLKTKLLSSYAPQFASSRHMRRSRLAAVALLIALLIGVFVWFSSTNTVSAAEIVNRASQVVNGTNAFGLQSYRGIKLYWRRSYYALESMGELKISMQESIWTEGRKERHEYYEIDDDIAESRRVSPNNSSASVSATAIIPAKSTAIPVAQGRKAVFTMLQVIDGQDNWALDVKSARINVSSLVILGAYQENDPRDMASLLKMLSHDNDSVKLTGSAVIAGRDVYVLQYTPKSDVPTAPLLTSVVSFIDKQAYIPLAMQYFNAKGEVLDKWEYVNFEANPTLDPSLFTIQTPPNVQVQDLRLTTILTQAELIEHWKEVAAQVQFDVFVPTYLPDGFVAEKPQVESLQSQEKGSFFIVRQEFYPRTSQHWPIYIGQWPKDRMGTAPGVTMVQIGDVKGNYSNTEGRHLLTFIRIGTMIQLQAALRDFTKEEIIKVAEGMQPLSKLGTLEAK